MEHHSLMEGEVCVDIESVMRVINANDQEGILDLGSTENHAKQVVTKSCDHFMSVDDHLVKFGVETLNVNEENINRMMEGKEKRKKASSAKKPPKPPRPHRGFSLDAADQKLIKELAELAMIKRARIERMKALMQKKASKASSSNSSLFAMIFTIIVFLVILFQGMSCQISCGTFEGSPHTTQTNKNGLIFIQENLNPSGHDSV